LAEAKEKAGPEDYAAKSEQGGGPRVIEMVKPLFTAATNQKAATSQAGSFVEALGKFDPLMRSGLANALYKTFKREYAQWADTDRGITPETWNAFREWQVGGSAHPANAGVPQPGPNNIVVFHEPDGSEYELDLTDPIRRELYELRKERFAQAERQKADEARAAEERVAGVEQQRAQRVHDFYAARNQAFSEAWDAVKPDWGSDPDLQF